MERKSQRNALRYQVKPRQINYSLGTEAGVATLINISTAGLLVELATVPVSVGDEITVSLSCFNRKIQEALLLMKARVVRVSFDEFAASFIDSSREQTELLLRILAEEIRGNGELR